jgi:hypothetical protein
MTIRIFALALLTLLICLNWVNADADFIDVRTTLERDRSGTKGDPAGKYFRMHSQQLFCPVLVLTVVLLRR